jgi:hypothetical protein
VISKNYTIGSSLISRNLGFTAQLNYDRNLGSGRLTTTAGYFYYLKENPGSDQDVENINAYMRANYALNSKYVFEVDLGYMGSNRFKQGNRYFLSPVFGAAWIISDESFMQNVSVIDYLKIKGSWGKLGYDASTNHYLYQNRWYNNGNMIFGESNNGLNQGITSLDVIGNPELDWETSQELNIGIEGIAVNNRLFFELNYFDETRDNIIEKVNSQYSALFGGLFPAMNWGKVNNRGFEGQIYWEETKGNLIYKVGGNFIYSKNKVLQKDEIAFPDEYRQTVGLSSDAMMGYRSRGLFGRDVDLNGAPNQSFGYYGVGDIAYLDLNNDAVIDDRDLEKIGNSFPRTTLGLDINLQYKGWGLYTLGTASLGVNSYLNNAYYTNYGTGKYSNIALDRYHAVNNPEGSQPRLTTTQADNNRINSDFWMENTGFFRLKNVELSYTLTSNSPNAVLKKVIVYTRSNNLLVVSKVKDLDPEALNAGVLNYPVMSTITAGVSVLF